MNAEQLVSLRPALAGWVESFRPCFKRASTFGHFQSYLLGLLAELRRKSVEPMALASGVAVRTLQEFLSMFAWDHRRLERMLRQRVAGRCPEGGIGVIDATSHPKRGDQTPGVQRQYCGESGKLENCVVAQHLLFTDDDRHRPFSCVLASDLFLPQAWAADRERCQRAGIDASVTYRPKWQIALAQVQQALADGVKLNWVVFDEEYGKVPAFWLALDAMGQRGVGEVPSNFYAWVKRPACRSVGYAGHAAHRVDHLCTHSPAFTRQAWQRCQVKDTTRGTLVWEYKATPVHLRDASHAEAGVSVPTDRRYWLVVMRQPRSGEIKYVLSNAPTDQAADRQAPIVEELIRVLLSRWHVEQWFERAKQEAGLGAFEVRTYVSLIRHWLCVRLAMYFLSEQTTRLRGEKSGDHLRTGRHRGGDAGHQTLARGVEQLVAIPAAMCVLPAT